MTDQELLTLVLESLRDLRGYSGVGSNGDPTDTESWNAALASAAKLIQDRYLLLQKNNTHQRS